jgi:hypothetical protein
MAVVEKTIRATPEEIFAVLADGWSYSDWVVGTAHIRDVDDNWPAPGALLHHKIAMWPFSMKDKTVVVASDPPRSLLLRAYMGPLGEATVKMTLVPLGAGVTKVTMAEDFAGGPLRWVRNKAEDLTLHWRNKEALSRLDDLATRRGPR